MSESNELLDALSTIFDDRIRFFSLIYHQGFNKYIWLGEHNMFILRDDFEIETDEDNDNIKMKIPYSYITEV